MSFSKRLSHLVSLRLIVLVLALISTRCGATAPWEVSGAAGVNGSGAALPGTPGSIDASTRADTPSPPPTDPKGGCLLAATRSPVDFGAIPAGEGRHASVAVFATGPNGACRVTRILKGAGLRSDVFVTALLGAKLTQPPFDVPTPTGANRFDLIVYVRPVEASESGSIHVEYESPARSIDIIVRATRAD